MIDQMIKWLPQNGHSQGLHVREIEEKKPLCVNLPGHAKSSPGAARCAAYHQQKHLDTGAEDPQTMSSLQATD